MLAEILELIHSNSPAMISRLIDAALHNPDPHIWMEAAEKLLNRGFGKPSQQVEVIGDVAHTHFVLRAPAVMSSADEWEAKYGDHPQVIDVQPGEPPEEPCTENPSANEG